MTWYNYLIDNADQKIVGNLFQPHNWKLFIKASGGKLQWTSLARLATYNFLEFSDMYGVFCV